MHILPAFFALSGIIVILAAVRIFIKRPQWDSSDPRARMPGWLWMVIVGLCCGLLALVALATGC